MGPNLMGEQNSTPRGAVRVIGVCRHPIIVTPEAVRWMLIASILLYEQLGPKFYIPKIHVFMYVY